MYIMPKVHRKSQLFDPDQLQVLSILESRKTNPASYSCSAEDYDPRSTPKRMASAAKLVFFTRQFGKMICYSKQLQLEGYYIYGYLREKDDEHGKIGTFYYIGKGKNNRAVCRHNFPIPKDPKNIIIIEHALTEENSHTGERELVAKYGRIDLGTGILKNRTKGGQGFATQNKNTVLVKNSAGERMRVAKSDPRLTTGELVGINKGCIPVRDKFNNVTMVDKNDPRVLSGELVHARKNLTQVMDTQGNRFCVPKNDIRITTGELSKTATVKDKTGNRFVVAVNDPRIITGEVVGVNQGNKRSKKQQ